MTMPNSMHDIFDKFSRNRERLLQICDQCIAISRSVGQNAKAETIRAFREKLQDDRFRIIVLGSFKRGKSTFINALLGQEVLPNFATPCTAVINEVKWSEEKRVKIHFKNPLPKQLPDGLAKEALGHIQKHRNAAAGVPSLEVDIDQLEHYVVIPDPAKDQAEGIAESPFEFAEILWPLELCQNGVEVIDSPGLDEHESRTRVTEMYLTKADAILFVQSCSALAGKSEMNFVENNLRANGFEDIIYICNRYDEIREKERPRIREYALSKLGPKTSLKERGIFFISAADALDGRLEKNDELIVKSGIVELEKQLFLFLVDNRGTIKTLQPARKLLQESHVLTREIGNARKLYNENLESLRKRAREMKEEAEKEKRRILQILANMENSRMQIRDDSEKQFYDFFNYKLPEEIERSMKDYAVKSPIQFAKFEGMMPVGLKKQLESVVKEVQEEIQTNIEAFQAQWQKKEFQPYMERQLKLMGDRVNDSIEEVFQAVESMRANIVGVSVDQNKIGATQQVSGLERVLAGVGGWLISGPGGAMLGGMFGYQEMLKSILPSIGIVIAGIIVGVTNPWILIAALMAGGTVQGWFKTMSMTKQVKNKVVDDYVKILKEKARDSSKDAATRVYSETAKISDLVEKGLRAEIQSVLDMADNAIREHELGESDKKQKQLALDRSEEDLIQMRTQLDELIMEVAL